MSVTLRVILIVCSFISFFLCIKKIKQSKLKVANSVTWMLGSIILILMSIFSNAVEWLSKIRICSTSKFCILVMIAFFINSSIY